MLKHQHKTLARTLAFIGFHSPGEFGLFWDADGTMPWKEFYWALQQDPSLRFVREASLRELSLLGIEMPFSLDGNVLRLAQSVPAPAYEAAVNVPARLYLGVRPKNLVPIQEFGLKPTARPFLPLCSRRELALDIAKRREPEPILIEILAQRAHESGLSFLAAGPELYLVEAVPREFLMIPKIRDDLAERLAERKQKTPAKPPSPTPGTFIVQPHHVQSVAVGEKGVKKGGKKEKGGWKKDSRKERRKRDA